MRTKIFQAIRLRSPLALAVLTGLFVFTGGPALQAEIYQWEDEKGVVHMTDDLGKVPKKYYSRTREITLPEREGGPEESEPPLPPALDTPLEEADYDGHDRDWWLQRMNGWKQRKAEAERQLAQAKKDLDSIPPNLFYAEQQQRRREIEKEINGHEAEIREADRMLREVLPEEARKAGAPPGWVRD